MSSLKTPSVEPKDKGAPLTPEQRYEGENNLVHLLLIAHREGVDAALAEWHRMLGEKVQSSAGP